jgi:hypothetical protein
MKRILIGVAVLIVIIQFIRPDMSNGPEDPAMNIKAFVKIPDEISAILKRSCGDCHSNTTRWPWYNQIAPASWVIADDVSLGRKHLNFSEWGTYTQKRMGKKLYQIAEVAGDNSMPLTLYRMIHTDTKLSEDERKKLADWADRQADQLIGEGSNEEEAAKH